MMLINLIAVVTEQTFLTRDFFREIKSLGVAATADALRLLAHE
jgi:hypothetical protein